MAGLVLKRGQTHDRFGADGSFTGCFTEAAAWLAGERHTDAPVCVSPVVVSYGVALNDGMLDVDRQRLRPFVARTLGTADDGLDEWRIFRLVDAAVRVFAPISLDANGWRPDDARRLRALPEIKNAKDAATVVVGAATSSEAWAANAVRWAAYLDSQHSAAWAAGEAVVAAARWSPGVWDLALGLLDEILPLVPIVMPWTLDAAVALDLAAA